MALRLCSARTGHSDRHHSSMCARLRRWMDPSVLSCQSEKDACLELRAASRHFAQQPDEINQKSCKEISRVKSVKPVHDEEDDDPLKRSTLRQILADLTALSCGMTLR
eukprot:2978041-Amphidinium_carterae.1